MRYCSECLSRSCGPEGIANCQAAKRFDPRPQVKCPECGRMTGVDPDVEENLCDHCGELFCDQAQYCTGCGDPEDDLVECECGVELCRSCLTDHRKDCYDHRDYCNSLLEEKADREFHERRDEGLI